MTYVQCTRCQKIDRDSRMQDNICEDCRSVEFSDFVIVALKTPMAYTVFFAKVRQEAKRLGLVG